MTPPLDLSGLNEADKDALILAQAQAIALLTEQLKMFSAEAAVLHAKVAELEAKLNVPSKTPGNSSKPPSQGQKSSEESKQQGRRKSHRGAHRALHPSPTSRRDVVAGQCEHCGTDVSGQSQSVCEAYDHIEIPEIKPDVTRVSLMGGVCIVLRRTHGAQQHRLAGKTGPKGFAGSRRRSRRAAIGMSRCGSTWRHAHRMKRPTCWAWPSARSPRA